MAGGPLVIEPWQVLIERTLAGPEDIVAFAADLRQPWSPEAPFSSLAGFLGPRSPLAKNPFLGARFADPASNEETSKRQRVGGCSCEREYWSGLKAKVLELPTP